MPLPRLEGTTPLSTSTTFATPYPLLHLASAQSALNPGTAECAAPFYLGHSAASAPALNLGAADPTAGPSYLGTSKARDSPASGHDALDEDISEFFRHVPDGEFPHPMAVDVDMDDAIVGDPHCAHAAADPFKLPLLPPLYCDMTSLVNTPAAPAAPATAADGPSGPEPLVLLPPAKRLRLSSNRSQSGGGAAAAGECGAGAPWGSARGALSDSGAPAAAAAVATAASEGGGTACGAAGAGGWHGSCTSSALLMSSMQRQHSAPPACGTGASASAADASEFLQHLLRAGAGGLQWQEARQQGQLISELSGGLGPTGSLQLLSSLQITPSLQRMLLNLEASMLGN